MLKNSIYLFVALFITTFLVFQSCGDKLVTGNLERVGILHDFFGLGTNKPVRCDSLQGRLELWAGVGNTNAGTFVGYANFNSVSGSKLNVTYELINPWGLEAVHFGIYNNFSDIPLNDQGNIPPGQLTYVHDFTKPYPNTWTFEVTLPDSHQVGTYYYVIAHASVCEPGGIEGFAASLPENPVNLCATGKRTLTGYWEFDLSNAGFLNGHYNGWCIDPYIGGVEVQNPCTSPSPTELYSSYETLPPDILAHIQYPDNLNLVNWILNNFTPEVTSVTKYSYDKSWWSKPFDMSKFVTMNVQETVTMGDIQYAIWVLLSSSGGTLYDWDTYRINGILFETLTKGEGFIPAPGQKIGLILIPYRYNLITQPMITAVTLNSEDCETALGDGKTGKIIGKNWFTYFRWDETCH